MITLRAKWALLFLGLLVMMPLKAHAQVNVAEIGERVQNGIEQELKLNKLNDAEKLKRIHRKIQILTDSITSAKMQTPLDEEPADWIMKGIIGYVVSREGVVGLSSPEGDTMRTMAKYLTPFFNSLSNDKAHKMMELSHRLLGNAHTYREKLQRYLLGKLSSPKYIKIRLDSKSHGLYLGNFNIGSIAQLLAATNPQPYEEGRSSIYNAVNNEVDSRILTLSLVKFLKRYFEFVKTNDDFSYGSSMSRIFLKYNTDDPPKILNLQEVLPRIDKYLSKVMRKDDDTLLISASTIQVVLYGLLDVRTSEVSKKPINIPDKLDDPDGFYVKFHNYKDSWKLIEPDNQTSKK